MLSLRNSDEHEPQLHVQRGDNEMSGTRNAETGRERGWARSFTSLAYTPMTSRWPGKRVIATDHTLAIIRTCPQCFEPYLVKAGAPDRCSRCAPADHP